MSPSDKSVEHPGSHHLNVRADDEAGQRVYECSCTISGVADPAVAAGEAIVFASRRLKDAGYPDYPVHRWVVTVIESRGGP